MLVSKFFSDKELNSKDGATSPYPKVVQQSLLDLLDSIRDAWGKPVLVNCAYRSPSHNKAVGGVDNSFHVQGLAADIRPKDLAELPEFQRLCNKMNPDGGVGYYNTFCHVDTRGYAARWDNR